MKAKIKGKVPVIINPRSRHPETLEFKTKRNFYNASATSVANKVY